MSADDQIFIQRNSKGRWVAQWCSASGGPGDPDKVPQAETYATMQLAIEMNHDRARETEYGFVFSEAAYAQVQEENKKQAERDQATEALRIDLYAVLKKHNRDHITRTPNEFLADFLVAELEGLESMILQRAEYIRENSNWPGRG